MREVVDTQVGTSRAQHAGHERERVVLDEHDLAVGRDVDHRVGERTVHRHVRVPRDLERLVECRIADQVEEPVEQEPQDLVRHHLVMESVLDRVERDEPHAGVERRG